MTVRVIASRTASARCPASAGPFFTRGASPCPANRGRCNSIVKRVVRSTSVPIAELPRPRMRSPSQCPGTALSAAMLEELLAAEELVIGVLDPTLAQHLVGEVVGVLEDRQPRHHPRRQRRPPGIIGVDLAEPLFQE